MKGSISAGNTKQRESNLELFRIVTMLLIIAHHYVVNSGLRAAGGPITQDPMALRSLFLLVVGAFGKTGINCFVLITGYFMCQSSISAKKFAKLYLEVIFYYLTINFVFWVTGYSGWVLQDLIGTFYPGAYIYDDFVCAFLLFYLCIPFLNRLIHNLNQREHMYLLLLTFVIYVIPGTFGFVFFVSMNHVSWYSVLYLLSSYVRKYPNALFEDKKIWGIMTIVSMFISALSVVVCTGLGVWLNKDLTYYFVTGVNTFLALSTAFSGFMYFKNLKMAYHPVLNMLASTCLGVLQIHGSSDAMRRWLWQDVLDNCCAYYSDWMPLHLILSTLGIFLLCAGIDLLRQKYLERPFFCLWDKYWGSITEKFRVLEEKIVHKLSIQN